MITYNTACLNTVAGCVVRSVIGRQRFRQYSDKCASGYVKTTDWQEIIDEEQHIKEYKKTQQ